MKRKGVKNGIQIEVNARKVLRLQVWEYFVMILQKTKVTFDCFLPKEYVHCCDVFLPGIISCLVSSVTIYGMN